MSSVSLVCLAVCGVLSVMISNSCAAGSIIIEAPQLRLTLGINQKGLSEKQFVVSGKVLSGVSATPWVIETDAGTITPANAVLESKSADSASFKGNLDELDWKLDYKVLGSGMITKTSTLTPKRDLLLKQVSLWQLPVRVGTCRIKHVAAGHRGFLSGRTDRGCSSRWISLTRGLSLRGSETSVTYPPFDKLKAGQAYTCHSLTFGATALTGRIRYGFDEGEVDAMDTYVQTRFAPRFNRPMFVSACINNRYTMPKRTSGMACSTR